MARDETWHGADGGTEVHRERRRLDERRGPLAARFGDLVAAARGHVVADVAEQFEGQVEPLVGVALLEERDDQLAAFVDQLRLQILADAAYVAAVVLLGVAVLQRRVEVDEPAPDPRSNAATRGVVVECC